MYYEQNKKDKSKALAGTILFHLALITIFIFFGLKKPEPLPQNEGVVVDLGYIDYGSGELISPAEPTPSTAPEPSQRDVAEDNFLTQDIEETIDLSDDEQDKVEEDISDVVREEPEPEPEPEPDPRATFPGRDDRSDDTEGRGDTDIPGFQGSPDGEVDGERNGTSGRGEGVQYSLSGRNPRQLPMPDYTSPETGRVVVSITVNRQGDVVRASAGARGTTTSNRTLWNLAEKAARDAKFDASRDAPEQQRGTITYNFIRVN